MNKSILQDGILININPWRMLTWLLIAQIMVAFVGRSLAPLGVLIGEDLSLTKAQIGMLPAALFLGQSLVSIPAGFVADRIGSKKLLFLLSLCLGLSFILMTLTSVYALVLFMVVLGGIGYGTMHPTSNKGIIYWFSEKRGTAMGIKQMGVTLGSALAALLMLPAAVAWGWRPVLFGACLLLIITGLLAYRFYHDPPAAESQGTEKPARLFASILQMFQEKPLVLVSLAAMGLSGSQLILNTYIVLFAYEHLGISLVLAGMLLVISEVSGSFGRVAWGVISDNLFSGKRIIVLVIIASLSILTSLVISQLPEGTSFWVMVPITVLFGFCISGFNGIWMNAATELVPIKQAGIASGFSLTLGSWGVIIGPPLFGYIVDVTGDFTYGWLFLALMLAAVIALLLLAMVIVKKEHRNQKIQDEG
ncbi:sugar phosphate permease [Planomicrobium stackebrandtii]|uniref:Sugar phosphate permease n=1 Tax=Planomicrobium stackebrandtii TaxID=253160 RepID=A0ABU0GVW2_9BACL|nr:MFS transporter [Planomicrobium stackebrandtii]MDQ0429511.1 sugar phosphate permease [Planomicrobium stackebrandtii]